MDDDGTLFRLFSGEDDDKENTPLGCPVVSSPSSIKTSGASHGPGSPMSGPSSVGLGLGLGLSGGRMPSFHSSGGSDMPGGGSSGSAPRGSGAVAAIGSGGGAIATTTGFPMYVGLAGSHDSGPNSAAIRRTPVSASSTMSSPLSLQLSQSSLLLTAERQMLQSQIVKLPSQVASLTAALQKSSESLHNLHNQLKESMTKGETMNYKRDAMLTLARAMRVYSSSSSSTDAMHGHAAAASTTGSGGNMEEAGMGILKGFTKFHGRSPMIDKERFCDLMACKRTRPPASANECRESDMETDWAGMKGSTREEIDPKGCRQSEVDGEVLEKLWCEVSSRKDAEGKVIAMLSGMHMNDGETCMEYIKRIRERLVVERDEKIEREVKERRLAEEMRCWQEEKTKAMIEKVRVLEGDLARVTEEKESIRKDVDELRSWQEEKTRAMMERMRLVENNLARATHDASDARRETETERREKEEMQERVRALETEMGRVQKEAEFGISKAVEERERLKQRSRDLESEVEDFERRIATLQKEKEEEAVIADREREAIEEELRSVKIAVGVLEAAIEEVRSALRESERGRKEAEERAALAEMGRDKAVRDRLEATLFAEAERSRLNQELALAKESLAKQKIEDMQAAESERQRFEKELKIAEEDKIQETLFLKLEKERLKKELIEVQGEVESKEHLCLEMKLMAEARLQDSLTAEADRTRMEKELAVLQEHIIERDKLCCALNEIVEVGKRKREMVEEERKALEEERMKVMSELQVMEANCLRMKANIDNLVSDSEAKEKSFLLEKESMEQKLQNLAKEREQEEAHRQGVELRMKHVEMEKQELTDALDQMKNKLLNLEFDKQALIVERDVAVEKYRKELKERRKVFNQLQELRGNVRVFCRVRPLTPEERMRGEGTSVQFPEEGEVIITHPLTGRQNSFEFDKVFPHTADQAAVFAEVQPLLTSVLDGFHACVFAYGQTGSGKTYTMDGTSEDWGMNPRILQDLMGTIKEKRGNIEYTVSISALEIYNEQVRDLLVENAEVDANVPKLEIRQGGNGVHVPGLTIKKIGAFEDALALLCRSSSARATTSTCINERSSRSHSVVTVFVHGSNKELGMDINGRLVLVDLAGSERIFKSEAEGVRLKEARHINRSLSALGDVVAALASKAKHVPYRNSTLTYLLQDSLGKDGKTLMIVQASPTRVNALESICSLNFAQRARGVECTSRKRHLSIDSSAAIVTPDSNHSLNSGAEDSALSVSAFADGTPSHGGSPASPRSSATPSPCSSPVSTSRRWDNGKVKPGRSGRGARSSQGGAATSGTVQKQLEKSASLTGRQGVPLQQSKSLEWPLDNQTRNSDRTQEADRNMALTTPLAEGRESIENAIESIVREDTLLADCSEPSLLSLPHTASLSLLPAAVALSDDSISDSASDLSACDSLMGSSPAHSLSGRSSESVVGVTTTSALQTPSPSPSMRASTISRSASLTEVRSHTNGGGVKGGTRRSVSSLDYSNSRIPRAPPTRKTLFRSASSSTQTQTPPPRGALSSTATSQSSNLPPSMIPPPPAKLYSRQSTFTNSSKLANGWKSAQCSISSN